MPIRTDPSSIGTPCADAIDDPARHDGQKHRQQRVERNQHADGERRRAHRQRVERDDHPASGQDRVVGDPERDQCGERARVGARLTAHGASRSMTHAPACSLVATIANPIVQPRGATLPELDGVGSEAISAPMRRTRHGAAVVAIARLHLGEAGLQRRAPPDGLALRRRPRSELRRARTAREIVGRFGGVERRREALDPHLPLELGPEEEQRRGGICRKLAALAALVVREEHEAAGIERA